MPAGFLIAIAFLFVVGCERERLTKKEFRSVTAEIAGVAQRVTKHRSEITIRPGAPDFRSDPSTPLSRTTSIF
jgi:hypothetical protein